MDDVLVNDVAVLRHCPNLRCNRPMLRMEIMHEDEETVTWSGSCHNCKQEYWMSTAKEVASAS